MSTADMSRKPDTPLATVSLDTFVIVAAIVFSIWDLSGTATGPASSARNKDFDPALQDSIKMAAKIISWCQQFDWAAHQQEINLPKGEQ